jgi:NAD(P)-dependent dehydrogenase (short-subunit alcohol dehydrogenase family)
MTVGVVTGAGSGMGQACVERLRGTVDHLASRVAELGPFRFLAHAAGLSPTMAEPRRIVDVNLVGTVRLLDAFEPLVELIRDPRAADFLDRVEELLTDSGIAYGWSKKGVQLEAAKAAVRWGPKGGRVVSMSPGLIDTRRRPRRRQR